MTPLRLRSASAALLLAFVALGTHAAASQRDDLIARWKSANASEIAAIHDPKARAKAQAAFAKTQSQLETNVAPATLPDFAASARRELAIPGRYQLSEKVAPAPAEPWYVRALTWLGDRVRDLWQALFGRAHLSRGGAIAVGDVLLAALVILVIFVGVRFYLSLQLERRRRATQSEALEPPADARALYEQARAAAARGDLGVASRLLFAASVVALDLRGVVAEDRSATVGDLRRALRSREASLVPSFDAVATPFVASAYAERPVAASDWERAHDAFLTFVPETAT